MLHLKRLAYTIKQNINNAIQDDTKIKIMYNGQYKIVSPFKIANNGTVLIAYDENKNPKKYFISKITSAEKYNEDAFIGIDPIKENEIPEDGQPVQNNQNEETTNENQEINNENGEITDAAGIKTALNQAIENSKQVSVKYNGSWRDISPISISQGPNADYLLCYNSDGAARTYRIDRIEILKALDTPANTHPDGLHEDLSDDEKKEILQNCIDNHSKVQMKYVSYITTVTPVAIMDQLLRAKDYRGITKSYRIDKIENMRVLQNENATASISRLRRIR